MAQLFSLGGMRALGFIFVFVVCATFGCASREHSQIPVTRFSIVKQKQGESQSSAGTWKIEDGFLTMTFTTSSITNHNSPVGMTERYHIIHLDSHELQMESVVPIVTTINR